MVQDFFSVYSKDGTSFLLRIHHKVDFAEEIAWAHLWTCDEKDFLRHAVPYICQYLTQGFDSIEGWDKSDQIAWHESIQHLGFKKVLVEMELVPKVMAKSGDDLVSLIYGKLLENRCANGHLLVPSYVGCLADSLRVGGCEVLQPRDALATLEVRLGDVFDGNWERIARNVGNYS